MTRTTKRCLIGLAVLSGLFAAFLIEERVRGHLAIEAWKRQMRVQGEKLTIAELTPPVTNTGVRVLTPSQFQAMLVASGGREPVFAKDSLPPGKEVVLWRLPSWKDERDATITWTAFATTFQSTRERLEQFRQKITNQPLVVHLDYEQGFDLTLPHLAQVKATAQALRRGTLLALSEQALDEAAENLKVCVALLDIQNDEPLLISQLVRIACAEISLAGVLWQALQAEGWTDAQLASIQTAWERIRFLPGMARSLEMERAVASRYFSGDLGGYTQLAQAFGSSEAFTSTPLGGGDSSTLNEWLGPVLETGQGFRRATFLLLWQIAWAEQDQLFHHQAIQHAIEAARVTTSTRSAAHLRRPGEKGEELEFRVLADYRAESNGSVSRFKHWLSLMILGAFDMAFQKALQTECRREMSVAAIALKRYRLRHGEWPPDLDALVPEFVSEVPRDWMSGRPLLYRRNADGTFALYSVGSDGKDDGGDPAPPEGPSRSMFRGRDWVWDQPATEEEISAMERETSPSRRRFAPR